LKPPTNWPSTSTWGKVIIPVFAANSTRPSGFLERLTSANSSPRDLNRPFTRAQYPHGSVVYTVMRLITSESIAVA
jgi:hypothetical protein